MNNMKNRVVILGKKGFIAKNLIRFLKKKKIKHLTFSKETLDLCKKNSSKKLQKFIQPNDQIVFLSTYLPKIKNEIMFKKNILILKNVVKALEKNKFSQILYVSSDAVYDENVRIINENTKKRPLSFYGKMHLKRENTLKKHFLDKLCIVRPTMIFGKNDDKIGYGPDKFLKQITQLKNIYLFGVGEEKRDHVCIDNVVATIYCCLINNFRGSLNIASGKVFSFLDIAKECLKKNKKKKIKIKLKPRKKIMPYGGYREFDIRELKLYMNTKKFVKLKNYISDY